MPTEIDTTILQYLKTNGTKSETEIAEALRLPLARVRSHVETLSSSGDIVCCSQIKFKDGKAIEGISCRPSCYTPPPARGRKPGVKNASASTEQHREV